MLVIVRAGRQPLLFQSLEDGLSGVEAIQALETKSTS